MNPPDVARRPAAAQLTHRHASGAFQGSFWADHGPNFYMVVSPLISLPPMLKLSAALAIVAAASVSAQNPPIPAPAPQPTPPSGSTPPATSTSVPARWNVM